MLINLLLVSALVVALWGVSLALKNASIVDIFWGFGFVVIAWSSWLLARNAEWSSSVGQPSGVRPTVLAVMVTLWGLRLAAFLAWRNTGKGEDYRYAAMRAQRPDRFWIWSLPCVFLLQGVLMWVVALPLQLASGSTAPLNWLDGVGMLVWGTGWLCESVGDWQLARFKARGENRGRVMREGLWRYTRHPNYFGDFLVWWGLFLVAAASGGIWWTVISPLIMSVLLLRVSGVALLEKTIGQRRPEYAEYARSTSAFVPWPPRKSSGH